MTVGPWGGVLLLGALLQPGGTVPGVGEAADSIPVSRRSWSPVAAVELRFPAGSSGDPAGSEGLAALTGAAVEEATRGRIPPSLGRVRVRVSRRATRVVLIAPADRWRPALDSLVAALGAPLPADAVDAARAAVLRAATFAAGSPVRAFEDRVRALLAGPESPWSRPAAGPAALRALDLGAVRKRQERALAPDRARVAVVAPDEAGAVRAAVDSAGLPLLTPLSPEPRGPAWRDGRREVVGREVTNEWTAIAFPVAPETSDPALALLVAALDERLNPTPPDPELYGTEVEVVRAPDGPVLRITATLEPGFAFEWEERILEAVEALATHPLPDPVFRVLRRRHGNERLLALATPEAEARAMLDGRGPAREAEELPAALRSVEPGHLARAARELGPPRVLLYGPMTDPDADP